MNYYICSNCNLNLSDEEIATNIINGKYIHICKNCGGLAYLYSYENDSSFLEKNKEIKVEKIITKNINKIIHWKILLRTILVVLSGVISYIIIFNSDFIPQAYRIMNFVIYRGMYIQGPVSRYLLQNDINFESLIYAIVILITFIIGTTYFLPIIRPYNIKKEFNINLTIFGVSLLILVITSLLFNKDPVSVYEKIYNIDLQNNKDRLNQLILLKDNNNIISDSELVKYQREYLEKIRKYKNKKQYKYDFFYKKVFREAFLQDYIVLPELKNDTDNLSEIPNLIDDLFSILIVPDPTILLKNYYLNKINLIIKLLTQSDEFLLNSYNLNTDLSNNQQLETITITSDKIILILKKGSAYLKVQDKEYFYPVKENTPFFIKVLNNTSENLLLIYSPKYAKDAKYILINSKQNQLLEIKSNEQKILILFEPKTALPYAGIIQFKPGDLIEINKIYFHTEDYYSLTEKDYLKNTEKNVSKIKLFHDKIFITKDIDIKSFGLSKFTTKKSFFDRKLSEIIK